MNLMQSARFIAFMTALAAGTVASTAHAEMTAKLLHTFCKIDTCPDGKGPSSALLMDGAHNLYGTTSGVAQTNGTVFALTYQPAKGKWAFQTLYTFCRKSNCADGQYPSTGGPLVMDVQGSLYGTTAGGGINDNGTVYKLVPDAQRRHWTLVTLYDFCSKANCSDGSHPLSGLTYAGAQSGALYDGTSTLYGTTTDGGRRLKGVAFSLRPLSKGGAAERAIYSFCATGGSDCTDGTAPYTNLAMDGAGNLYGVTEHGGRNDKGVAFKLTPGSGATWDQTVLYRFCQLANCADGWSPQYPPVLDAAGNLYGTASYGGAGTNCQEAPNGCGVLFRIAADGTESTLYDFCTQSGCVDGDHPSWLALQPDGSLIGNANANGPVNHVGNLFRFDGAYQVLFATPCRLGKCPYGYLPAGPAVVDAEGNIFQPNVDDGRYNYGTVVEYTP